MSALAGARQMVLRYHEEYLIVQALQVVSPHFRVANLQSSEGPLFQRPVYVHRPPHIMLGGPEVGLRDPGGGTEPSAANPLPGLGPAMLL